MNNLDAWLKEGRTLPDGTVMSDERLAQVFDLVKPEPHWKYPIDSVVPLDAATDHEIRTAVAWYCGGTPEVWDDGGYWKVVGEGYYEWIGA